LGFLTNEYFAPVTPIAIEKAPLHSYFFGSNHAMPLSIPKSATRQLIKNLYNQACLSKWLNFSLNPHFLRTFLPSVK
jgi:hypothetical protein